MASIEALPSSLARRSSSGARVGAPVNPWVIAMVVTLATFMEVLDTSIALSLIHI